VKNDVIRLRLEKELKEEFIKACNGIPMSKVMIALIKKYIDDSLILKDGENK